MSIGFLLLYNEILCCELYDLVCIDLFIGVVNCCVMGEVFDCMFDEVCVWCGLVGVLLVDVDYFKNVNDCFGYDGGDKVL